MSSHKEIPFNSFRNRFRFAAVAPFNYLDRIENLIEGIFIDMTMMRDVTATRRELGLRKRHGFANEEGDFNLFPDLPQFSPVRQMPRNARYVGPLTWRNDLPFPESLRKFEAGANCIYFTIGSSGLQELLENIQSYIPEDKPVIVATGATDIGSGLTLPPNVFLEQFVNTEAVLPHCDLVVCHGGNGTIYQALAHGVPVVGVAMHEEQYYGLKRVKYLEVGLGFHVTELKKKGFALLGEAISEVLNDEKYRKNAQQFQGLLSEFCNGAERAADAIEEFLDSGQARTARGGP